MEKARTCRFQRSCILEHAKRKTLEGNTLKIFKVKKKNVKWLPLSGSTGNNS